MILMRILIYGAGVIDPWRTTKRWLMNTLEMPLANICGHGDVQVPTRDVVIKCCKKAGLKVEKFEIRKGMRMHCVVRKPMGKAIENER